MITKKKILVIKSALLLMTITSSCTSQVQSDFDLAKDALRQHSKTITSQNIKKLNSAIPFEASHDIIETPSEKVLQFSGVDFSGYVKKDKKLGKNRVIFTFPKKDSIIGMYQLHVYQTKKSSALAQTLEKLFGKAEFTSFNTKEDKVSGNYEGKIWIDKKNEISYLLQMGKSTIYQEEIVEASLYVVDNKQEQYFDWISTSPPFSFYGDYIDYKNHFEKPEDYSYELFVKEKLEKGTDRYQLLTEW
ncbi:hypothetical protein [Aquimarina pacifica]|uniref:hypothetical protein n=1 Tax=Aquimarina pacifica TaxID=1296415 RepID=UPI0004701CEF|nr:hypothetical protein [Aquimarina pacifica]